MQVKPNDYFFIFFCETNEIPAIPAEKRSVIIVTMICDIVVYLLLTSLKLYEYVIKSNVCCVNFWPCLSSGIAIYFCFNFIYYCWKTIVLSLFWKCFYFFYFLYSSSFIYLNCNIHETNDNHLDLQINNVNLISIYCSMIKQLFSTTINNNFSKYFNYQHNFH